MKVCILSSYSFERNYSSYHLMRDLIDGILKDGNEVVLIQKFFDKTGVLPNELKNRAGLVVEEIPFIEAAKSNLVIRMLKDMRYYYDSAKYIKKHNDCDSFFIQSNNTPYIPIWFIKKYTNKPIIYNVQDIFPQNAVISGLLSKKSPIYKVFLWLQKWSLKTCNTIITISDDMKQTLVNIGTNPEKVQVIYNWANEVHEESKIEICKEKDDKFHVVYAGNIGRMQNVDIIIKAAEVLNDNEDICFDIYGSGLLKNKFMEYVKEEHIKNIHFYDPVPANQAYALYNNADINIVPLANGIIKTALPSKTAVCLQCGKPVIFCIDKESKFGNLLTRNSIYVVDCNDTLSLVDKINIIIKDYDTINSLKSVEYYSRMFSRNSNIYRYIKLLNNIERKVQ